MGRMFTELFTELLSHPAGRMSPAVADTVDPPGQGRSLIDFARGFSLSVPRSRAERSDEWLLERSDH